MSELAEPIKDRECVSQAPTRERIHAYLPRQRSRQQFWEGTLLFERLRMSSFIDDVADPPLIILAGDRLV